VNTFSSLVLTN